MGTSGKEGIYKGRRGDKRGRCQKNIINQSNLLLYPSRLSPWTKKRREAMSKKLQTMRSSGSELDFDRPNLEDYLPTGSIHEPNGKLRL